MIDAALASLDAELTNWDDLIIEEIGRGTSVGGQGPGGEVGPMIPLAGGERMVPAPWEEINPDWWHIIVGSRTGWQHHREYYQGHDTTLLGAINGLTDELQSRRTDPHKWHIDDWMREGRFVRGCVGCETEARDLFNGEVDWEDE